MTPKRVVTVPVSQLPLAGPAAQHKFKLLAGARWTPEPPKDAGLGKNESLGEHGYFKISCEDFPKAAMNLKWISDTIDRLIAEANDVRTTLITVILTCADTLSSQQTHLQTSLLTYHMFMQGRERRRRANTTVVVWVRGQPSATSPKSGCLTSPWPHPLQRNTTAYIIYVDSYDVVVTLSGPSEHYNKIRSHPSLLVWKQCCLLVINSVSCILAHLPDSAHGLR